MKPLYLDETKTYLTTNKTYKELAKELGISNTSLSNHVQKTIHRLVEHFDFDKRGIEYPCLEDDYLHYGRFRECRKYSYYWLKVIEDYENGVQVYKTPEVSKDSRFIKDLTVSEFKDLLNDILSH
jgi:hypothetical protein